MCKCEEKTEYRCVDHGKGVRPNAPRRVKHAGMPRILGMNRRFEEPLRVQEGASCAGLPANNYHNYGKEIETALLEAERKKAEALMEWQKRRLIC